MSAMLRLGAVAALLLIAGCEAGPDYERPSAPVPAAYKETDPGWKVGQPEDAIDRGAWWSIYRDPILDGLERQVDVSNQTLKADEAAFRQAEALAANARAGLFPTLTANASAQRSRSSTSGGGGGFGGGPISNQFSLSANASWTPDLWGSVRRAIESSEATAQASAGTLAGARLSAQGSLASDYMELRIADELKRLLDQAVTAFADSLRITQNQYKAGTAAQSDVSQAQAQVEQTRAQSIAVGISRAQFEHAIAVLIGKPPSDFSISPAKQVPGVPAVPPGLPSQLLERRPDIAVAERQMAAQNAQIGVAEAAFYPTVTLSGDYGVQSSMLSKLFTSASRIWAFGSTAAQTLFDAGARQATLAAQRAVYDQTIANYRQTVLSAFQTVEDELAALRILAQQGEAAASALKAAREAERVINNQYLAGTVAYTSVIVAETTALNDAESVVNIRQSQLVASVALIEALGGGWNAAELPSPAKIESDQPLNFSPIPASDPHPVK
ncbi:MAG TPA: efflux transporter outer membrane subunit [Stellaceae bacterium]|jgi:NodT family efflux transporter outer membrane factor (OMF) lipoprotein|nr:efflux transporter outer membrane subunit [Stellaceae bacterium]